MYCILRSLNKVHVQNLNMNHIIFNMQEIFEKH